MERVLRVVGSFIALVVVGGLGVFLLLEGAGSVSWSALTSAVGTTAGMIGTLVVGAILCLASIRFLIAIADSRLEAAAFAYGSDLGRIGLTPSAVKELVSAVLSEEIGLAQYRIAVRHEGDGVAITIRTSLSGSARVVDVGERIQQRLVQRVPEQTGVAVKDVSVLVRRFRRGEGAA